MRRKLTKFAQMATLGLALVFTFSCNLGVGGGCMPAALCSGGGEEYTGGSCDAADYGSVNIDGQIWMAKNWGCYVPGSWCYEHKDANCEKYGRLYDWSTAMGIDAKYNTNSWGGSDVKHKGICPTGWHLPSDEDWDKLMNAVGGSSTAGRYLKTSDWGGENKYHFSALPGGYVTDRSYKVGYNGGWWSASENSGYYAYRRLMSYDDENVSYDNRAKSFLFSVRCLQD